MFQVKIWFQNRRTKWKKHENITATDINDQRLQNEKNPDVAKAIQNAAKLKKAKERAEQNNQTVVTTNTENLANETFQDRIASFSTHQVAAEDITEHPLCLVQDKYKTIPKSSGSGAAVYAGAFETEIKMEINEENGDTPVLDTDEKLMKVNDPAVQNTEILDIRTATNSSVGTLGLERP